MIEYKVSYRKYDGAEIKSDTFLTKEGALAYAKQLRQCGRKDIKVEKVSQ